MPLLSGIKNIGKNIKELITDKPGKTRSKAIRTLMERRGLNYKKAKLLQAKAISLNKAYEPKN